MSFSMLLRRFKWNYDHYMVYLESGLICVKKLDDDGLPMGKVRELNAICALGLVLMWYCTSGVNSNNLVMLFG